MRDVHVAALAGRQFNRLSRGQLHGLGLSNDAISHRVAAGRLVIAEEGVFAVAPLLEHDPWGQWMGATLTAPGSVLSHTSAAAAWGFWARARDVETITRPGSGGPRPLSGVRAYRSLTLEPHRSMLRGIPITAVPRTLLDLAAIGVSGPALRRALREAIRLRLTSVIRVADCLADHPGRHGCRRLADAIARYTGLPIERARSGAEVRAMEILRDAGRPLPRLNLRIAGEEADLSWPRPRLIVEIDGGPFHLDVGEDARKQACWESAGWTVRRIDANAVYDAPTELLALAPPPSPRR